MRVIDLTVPLTTGARGPTSIPMFNDNPVRLEVIGARSDEEVARLRQKGLDAAEHVRMGSAMVTRFTTLTHIGTHMDAPLHHFPEGISIDQVPADILVHDAALLDVSYKGPREGVTVADLERTGVEIGPDTIPVIRTGWVEKRWGKEDYWDGMPYLGAEVGAWLADKGVVAVAHDCLTDPPASANPTARACNHRALLGNGIIVIEYLTNMSQIRRPKFLLVATPLKLVGVDGSPVRVLAIEDR